MTLGVLIVLSMCLNFDRRHAGLAQLLQERYRILHPSYQHVYPPHLLQRRIHVLCQPQRFPLLASHPGRSLHRPRKQDREDLVKIARV